MDRLYKLIGTEHEFATCTRELKYVVHHLSATTVGALQVTCSDESEHECVSSFQSRLVDELLPPLKSGGRSAFRVANMGSHYPWGAVRLAERHFATKRSHDDFKVMIVKLNAHVHVEAGPDGMTYGSMERYRIQSAACGAIHALLEGEDAPYLEELREAFLSEGYNRLEILRDSEKVDPNAAMLFAALCSARLQARRAVLDIQHHPATSPTFYIVLPAVTLNRASRDTELLCGVYSLDHRSVGGAEQYRGLGDDPAKYRITHPARPLRVSDDQLAITRDLRDHRRIAHDHWKRDGSPYHVHEDQLKGIHAQALSEEGAHDPYTKAVLKIMLRVLAQLNPITAALLLFTEGVAEIHHVYCIHRLAQLDNADEADRHEARKIVDDSLARIDSLPEDKVEKLIKAFVSDHGFSGLQQP